MKPIHRTEWAKLILWLAIFLGTFMRYNPTLLAGFPINDGGMFTVMMEDLQVNHYRLPDVTTYNQLNIPYAYPPLGFYIGELLSDLFGWSPIQSLRWIPALFASLAIPAFHLLALRLLKENYQAAVATLFFALMPRAFMWSIMGGGLTRSLGQFFMLITLASLVRLYEENRARDVFWAGFFSGLAVMSHPEAATYTVVSAIFFWIMLSRNLKGLVNSLFVALITLVVSAPWWANLITHHGLTPLLSGAATGGRSLAIFHLLFFTFTEEPYATIIAVLGLIGIAYCLIQSRFLLPLWMVVPFLVAGRSATNSAAIPLAMLAAIGLVDVIFAAIDRSLLEVPEGTRTGKEASDLVPRAEQSVLICTMLYLVFSTYQFGISLSSAVLPSPDREAMEWVGENTPSTSRFLVLTGSSSIACDSVLEWFPALTGRQSVSTIQGTEWTQGKDFAEHVSSIFKVQKCLSSDDPLCLYATVSRSTYDYVYLSKKLRADNCNSLSTPREFPYFLEHIQEYRGLKTIYETEDVIVFRK